MLDRIQRDLFALGARPRRSASPHRRAGREGGARRTPTSRASRDGSTRSRRLCRSCGGSFCRADRGRRRAASGAHGLPPRRAAHGRPRRRTPSSRSPHLHQPPVRSALRHGPRGQRARRRRRNRVVADAGLRRVPASRAAALRELSCRVAAAARGRRDRISPRSTRLRASPTTSPTRATDPTRARLALLDDWQRALARSGRRRPRRRRRIRRRRRSSWRSATPCAGASLERAAVRRSAQRVSPGRRDQALRDLGGPARLLPAIGQSRRPAGAAHRRLPRRAHSTGNRTPSARRCSSRTSGRISSATGARAACTCRWRSSRDTGADERDLDGRRLSPAWRAALDEVAAADAAAVSSKGGRSPTRVSGRLRVGAARDVAWRHAHSRPARSGRTSTCSAHGPRSAGRTRSAIGWRTLTSALALELTWPARRASTTRSSSCPRPKRQAITAVFDFCRAVDDGVDLEPDPGARDAALELWRARGRARLRRQRAGDAGRAARCSRSSRRSACRASSSTRSSTASRWTLAAPVRDVCGPRAVLPPRRVGRRPDLRGDLRLPRCRRARLRARSRRRAAAHQHPARRRRGLPARPALPPARGSRAVRLHRGRHRSAKSTKPATASDRERMRAVLEHQAARARIFFARAVAALPRG